MILLCFHIICIRMSRSYVKVIVPISHNNKSIKKYNNNFDESDDEETDSHNKITNHAMNHDKYIDIDCEREELINARDEEMKNLEKDMNDINQIFKDLGSLVHNQGLLLDDIESNMTNTADMVGLSVTQLKQASVYQKKARRKAGYLFGITAGVGAILGTVLGIKLK